jgi:uncharacterized membrane protein (DUF373 family)
VSTVPKRASDRVAGGFSEAVRWLEIALAALVLVGILFAAGAAIRELWGLDWTASATFDRLLNRVLFIAIGLELVRMLVVHSLRAILEMMAFAIARNMLTPNPASFDMALGAVAFAVLLAAGRHFLAPAPKRDPEPAG